MKFHWSPFGNGVMSDIISMAGGPCILVVPLVDDEMRYIYLS